MWKDVQTQHDSKDDSKLGKSSAAFSFHSGLERSLPTFPSRCTRPSLCPTHASRKRSRGEGHNWRGCHEAPSIFKIGKAFHQLQRFARRTSPNTVCKLKTSSLQIYQVKDPNPDSSSVFPVCCLAGRIEQIVRLCWNREPLQQIAREGLPVRQYDSTSRVVKATAMTCQTATGSLASQLITIVKNRDKKDQQIWSHKSQERTKHVSESLECPWSLESLHSGAFWLGLCHHVKGLRHCRTLCDAPHHHLTAPHNQAKEAAMSLAFANERCFNESFTSMSLGWSKLGKRHLNRQRIQLAACRLVVFCHRDFFDWFVMICVFPLQRLTVRKRVTTTPGHPWV